MINAMANGVWKKALKKAVATVTGVVISNLTYHPGTTGLDTLDFWKHLAFTCLITLLAIEAAYWNTWAVKGEQNGNGTSNSDSAIGNGDRES